MKISTKMIAGALCAVTLGAAVATPASATPGLRGVGGNSAGTCEIMRNNSGWNYFKWRLTGRFYHYQSYYTEFLIWRSACQ
ncbi:MAG: hypothetical protein ACT6TH_10205 [Brevundimonas sp.]|uniref:hypothetical protein n=1 Tax=Brevundimonas sp. TaxID=1871086 RepID=UPI004033E45B